MSVFDINLYDLYIFYTNVIKLKSVYLNALISGSTGMILIAKVRTHGLLSLGLYIQFLIRFLKIFK